MTLGPALPGPPGPWGRRLPAFPGDVAPAVRLSFPLWLKWEWAWLRGVQPACTYPAVTRHPGPAPRAARSFTSP